MGFHGSVGSILLILVIAVLLFGTKKLRTMGEDLGVAIKGFKKGLKEESNDNSPHAKTERKQSSTTENG